MQATKIFIAIPTKGYIHCRTAASVDLTRKFLAEKGIKSELVFAEGTLVPAVRSILVAEFLKRPEFTHLLFVDSDQTFSREVVFKLLEHDKDIITAISKVRSNDGYNIYHYDEATSKYKMIPVDDSMKLLEIDVAGMGMMLIKRKVLATIPEIKMDGNLSEDFNFCKLAKELNFQVYTDCSCRLGHIVELELK